MSRPIPHRAGVASLLLLLFLPALLLFAYLILSIDRDRLTTTELRKAGVSAGLAAAGELAVDEVLTADPNRLKPVLIAARKKAQQVAAANIARGKPVSLPDLDVAFGHTDQSSGGTFAALDPNAAAAEWNKLNAVEVAVRVAADESKFSRIRAIFDTAVTGFRPTAGRPIPLAPFALYDGPPTSPGSGYAPTGWAEALSERYDDSRYNPTTGLITDGEDGLREVVVVVGTPYPSDPPVVPSAVLNIGATTHAETLAQIATGIRTADVNSIAFGNEFSLLPATMTRPVLGSADALDTRLAEVAAAFRLRIGEKRVWPLFEEIDADSNGQPIVIVKGFTAARLLKVDYAGGETSVRLTLQEAVLATPTAITRPVPIAGEPPPPPQKSVGKVRIAG